MLGAPFLLLFFLLPVFCLATLHMQVTPISAVDLFAVGLPRRARFRSGAYDLLHAAISLSISHRSFLAFLHSASRVASQIPSRHIKSLYRPDPLMTRGHADGPESHTSTVQPPLWFPRTWLAPVGGRLCPDVFCTIIGFLPPRPSLCQFFAPLFFFPFSFIQSRFFFP